MKKEDTIKQIDETLKDPNLDPKFRKSLEQKKKILTDNKDVKK